MYMYMCICICVYVYVSVYICIYAYMYVWMYVCMYVCMYICIYVCIFGLRITPSAVRAIFESRYLTICFEILYKISQSCSMKLRMHVSKFSWFLEVFCYVNHMCKVGLRIKYSAIRAIFESRYLTTCSEILY